MKFKVPTDFSKGIDRFHFSNQLIRTMTKLHMLLHQYHVLFLILTLPKTMSKNLFIKSQINAMDMKVVLVSSFVKCQLELTFNL